MTGKEPVGTSSTPKFIQTYFRIKLSRNGQKTKFGVGDFVRVRNHDVVKAPCIARIENLGINVDQNFLAEVVWMYHPSLCNIATERNDIWDFEENELLLSDNRNIIRAELILEGVRVSVFSPRSSRSFISSLYIDKYGVDRSKEIKVDYICRMMYNTATNKILRVIPWPIYYDLKEHAIQEIGSPHASLSRNNDGHPVDQLQTHLKNPPTRPGNEMVRPNRPQNALRSESSDNSTEGTRVNTTTTPVATLEHVFRATTATSNIQENPDFKYLSAIKESKARKQPRSAEQPNNNVVHNSEKVSDLDSAKLNGSTGSSTQQPRKIESDITSHEKVDRESRKLAKRVSHALFCSKKLLDCKKKYCGTLRKNIAHAKTCTKEKCSTCQVLDKASKLHESASCPEGICSFPKCKCLIKVLKHTSKVPSCKVKDCHACWFFKKLLQLHINSCKASDPTKCRFPLCASSGPRSSRMSEMHISNDTLSIEPATTASNSPKTFANNAKVDFVPRTSRLRPGSSWNPSTVRIGESFQANIPALMDRTFNPPPQADCEQIWSPLVNATSFEIESKADELLSALLSTRGNVVPLTFEGKSARLLGFVADKAILWCRVVGPLDENGLVKFTPFDALFPVSPNNTDSVVVSTSAWLLTISKFDILLPENIQEQCLIECFQKSRFPMHDIGNALKGWTSAEYTSLCLKLAKMSHSYQRFSLYDLSVEFDKPYSSFIEVFWCLMSLRGVSNACSGMFPCSKCKSHFHFSTLLACKLYFTCRFAICETCFASGSDSTAMENVSITGWLFSYLDNEPDPSQSSFAKARQCPLPLCSGCAILAMSTEIPNKQVSRLSPESTYDEKATVLQPSYPIPIPPPSAATMSQSSMFESVATRPTQSTSTRSSPASSYNKAYSSSLATHTLPSSGTSTKLATASSSISTTSITSTSTTLSSNITTTHMLSSSSTRLPSRKRQNVESLPNHEQGPAKLVKQIPPSVSSTSVSSIADAKRVAEDGFAKLLALQKSTSQSQSIESVLISYYSGEMTAVDAMEIIRAIGLT